MEPKRRSPEELYAELESVARGGADEIGTPEMEAVLMATFCVLGISLKAIGAQMEANELNEAWGE